MLLLKLIRDRSAQDMIEYALMAAGVTVAVAAFIPYQIYPALNLIYSRLNTVIGTLTGGS